MTRRRWVQIDGELIEVGQDWTSEPREPVHHVMPDIEPFQDNTGAVIGGRAQYREHLRRIGGVELGVSDLRRMMDRKREPQKDQRRVEQLIAAWDKVRPKRV